MATLFCFGLGYTATHFLDLFHGRFDRVFATVRDSQKCAEQNMSENVRRTLLPFDGQSCSPAVRAGIAESDAVLVSIPPDDAGDVVLATCADALLQASHLRSIVYLSTIGVYGNSDGAWVDERSPCRPGLGRNAQRLAAEQAWQELGAHARVPVAILRLAGIYGPNRNALARLKRGLAKRIVKPGQVFNRIHVADIARAIDAAFAHRADGHFNVADDAPSSPGDPIAFAAQLLGIDPPPEMSYADAKATMSPLAASFYSDVKRVRNAKLKSVLGVKLEFPTYREGLAALHRAGG